VPAEVDDQNIEPGWVDKPTGLLQVLWESGWIDTLNLTKYLKEGKKVTPKFHCELAGEGIEYDWVLSS
jgi:hypothetical protein